MSFAYIKPLTPKSVEYAQTTAGTLRGYKQEDIYHFLGVRYGECERWQTATPVKPWKGIKNAVIWGDRMFPVNGPTVTPWDSCGAAHDVLPYAEDALNINIWTPSLDKSAKKAVMFWIHGGGYATGSDMEMQCHDGLNLAKWGDVVVVGLNHRLNIFGCMDASEFGPQYANSGNAMLSDIVLALQWVRDNIENFGGDPNNVTLFGQSGGGGKIKALMQTPAANGLYHKAIVMSAASSKPKKGQPWEESGAASREILHRLLKKYNSDKIETLLDLTPEELLEAALEVGRDMDGSTPLPGMRAWKPHANGWYLGDLHSGAPVNEHAMAIPVMAGAMYACNAPIDVDNKHQLTEEECIEIVRQTLPEVDTEKAVELFKQAWPGKCLVDIALISDRGNHRQGATDLLDERADRGSAANYCYLFAHEFPQHGGRAAWHCADIPLAFHNSYSYPPDFCEGIQPFEDAYCGAYVAFAKTGDPNNEHLGIHWPQYSRDGKETIIFDDTGFYVKGPFDREFMELLRDPVQVKKYTRQTVN